MSISMPIVALAGVLAPIALLVGTGRVLRLTALPRPEHWAGIDKMAFTVLVPCLIASTLASADLGVTELGAFGSVLALSLGAAIVGLALLYPIYARGGRERIASYTSIFQTSTRWNAFVALAVLAQLHGSQAIALTALGMVVLMPIVNVVNVVVLTWLLTNGRVSILGVLTKIATNPIILGCAVGLALNFATPPIWTPFMDAVDTLGRASLAIVLLGVGAGLSFGLAAARPLDLLLACALKLVALPALVLAIGLALSLDGLGLVVAVLIAATPTAANGYVLAKEMGGDAPLYANTASAQVLASLVTMPIWLMIVGMWSA